MRRRSRDQGGDLIRYDRMELVKLYPEQMPQVRLSYWPGGEIYAYCNRHGLFQVK